MTAFEVGQQVMDRDDGGEVGTVETVRRDGMLNVRWPSGRTEWVHERTVRRLEATGEGERQMWT